MNVISSPGGDGFPPGGAEIGDDPPWEPWTPAEVAARLAGARVPWCVAGGWSLDLLRGEQTRPHEDLEIAVPSAGFPAIRRALAAYDIEVVGSGRSWPLSSPAFGITHQTWVREPAGGPYRLDVFREPHDGDTWVCRRDARIRLPYRDVIRHTPDGIPFLAPEITLLFKARLSSDRPKDQRDFRETLPLLDPSQRSWLRTALAMAHPGHPWIEETRP